MEDQILITFENPWYVIKDVNTGIVTQGETIDSAKQNLKEAVELYYEE